MSSQAIAATGGVIGIHFAGQLIDEEHLRLRDQTPFGAELAAWKASPGACGMARLN